MNTDLKSNKDLPITTKTVARVVNIALAKMARSYDLDNTKWTDFWDRIDQERRTMLEKRLKGKDEQGLLLTWIDETNWTLLTSHFLLGKINGKEIKAEIKSIKDYDFGLVKGLDGKSNELVVKMKWTKKKFIYETNGAGFMLMAGLDVLHSHWERGAIEK